ncbi:MAG: hypothetical protein ACE149_10285 [Armatimonadota bacterium]
MEASDRLAHLLPHWMEHNEGHIAQLLEWAGKARAEGMGEVAEAIEAAAAAMGEAKAKLTEAAERLGR